MYLLYLIALVPAVLGLLFFAFFTNRVTWLEWLLGAGLSFIVAAIFHVSAIFGMTSDIETWSGEINKATFFPEWVEQYETTETETDRDGNVTTHTETHYRTHEQYWELESNIDTQYNVEREKYDETVKLFGGGIEIEKPHKDGFYSGDPNIYVTYNRTGVVIPIAESRSWSNRVKCAPTVFSFPDVPMDVRKRLFDWPNVRDNFQTDRVLGVARNSVGTAEWDAMNAKLGPRKKVNVILCGWFNEDASIAEWQRSLWIGGKKNDIVICYGSTDKPGKAAWAKVFGWTEKEDVKRNLETIMLNNNVNNGIIPKIYDEISKNYVIKDWKKFDYISIEPTANVVAIMIGATIIIQLTFFFWAYLNDIRSMEDFVEWISNMSENVANIFQGRRGW